MPVIALPVCIVQRVISLDGDGLNFEDLRVCAGGDLRIRYNLRTKWPSRWARAYFATDHDRLVRVGAGY